MGDSSKLRRYRALLGEERRADTLVMGWLAGEIEGSRRKKEILLEQLVGEGVRNADPTLNGVQDTFRGVQVTLARQLEFAGDIGLGKDPVVTGNYPGSLRGPSNYPRRA